MSQHKALGNLYRNYLVKDLKYLPENFKPDVIYPRSTMVYRAIKSCLSFLQGLYPPASVNELVQIVTDTQNASFLDPDEGHCDELKGQEDYFIDSAVFKEYFGTWEGKFKEKIKHYIKDWNPKEVKKFVSWIALVACGNYTLPKDITDEVVEGCIDYLRFWEFGLNDNDKYRGVGPSPLFREMFRMADEFLAMASDAKFVILSSHDTELASMLPALTEDKLEVVAVATHLLFEIWDDGGIAKARFSVNGKPLTMRFWKNETLATYGHVKAAMWRAGYLKHCMDPYGPIY
jgi:acid phosphatase